ncbi:MAG TPA: hypothetical protein PKD90_00485, partial [Phnomibacter sp.]|nr:hypothetical protein [Phnomibacter sp.]
MKNHFATLGILLLTGLSSVAQTIYPVTSTWKERLEATVPPSANGHIEIKDGSYLQKELDKVRNMSMPIPAGAPITRYKAPAEGSIRPLSEDSPEPFLTMEGLSDGQLRGIGTIPPDTYGSVGYNEVVTVTNSEIVIRNKNNGIALPGTQQGIKNFFSALNFGGSAPDVFDPRVIFDPYANRYVVIVCVNGGNVQNSGFAIAVSQTGNPAGAWSYYAIDTDGSNTTWFDFPYVAFHRNWIAVSGNMFNADNVYQRSKIYVFDKNNLYSGGAITLGTNARELAFDGQGANYCVINDYDQTSDSMYVMQTWNGNNEGSSVFRLSAITGTLPNVLLNTVSFIVNEGVTFSTSSGSTDFAQQTGSAIRINTGDSRPGNAMRINNDIWFAHTIFQPVGNPDRCSPQWFQLGLNGQIKQREIIGTTPFQYRYYASIVANKLGDVLVGYSVSNPDIWASAAYRYRTAADPLNTTRNEYLFQEGRAVYNKTFGGARNRWGDYSNSVIDPLNQSLWTNQQFASSPALGANNQLISMWGTWWANVQASTSTNPLPVSLLQFDAQLADGGKVVQVQW